MAFDIETDGRPEILTRVIGIGVTAFEDEGYYFPFATWDIATNSLKSLVDEDYERGFVEALLEILQRKLLIMHNGVYDVTVMFHRYGIDLTEALHADTILMKHTLEEEPPFGLKDIAELFKHKIGFGSEDAANQEQKDLAEAIKAAGGKWTKKQKEIWKGPLALVGKYCCADVDLTLRLFHYFSGRLKKERLEEFFYNQEVMPLYRKATIQMKKYGVYADIPYFKKLEKELEAGIIKLTDAVFDLIAEDIQPFVKKVLNDKVKEAKTGRFALKVLQHYNLPIPSNKKTGKPTLAKSALQPLKAAYPGHPALEWLVGNGGLPEDVVFELQKEIYAEMDPENPRVFNLSSTHHLAWLLFDKLGQEPVSHSRKTGKPQVNKASLATYAKVPFVKVLLDLKKEEKLLSTYVKPIIETNVDGWLYPGMLQFGTTSGRYSCGGGLNLQTLPRDDKRIKRGFIAPPGYKVVNADFSSLEPRIFSWVSNDWGLKKVWIDGLDLYSQIAIDVFGLEGVSADEKAKNYLKKVMPDERQKSKVFTLAVPYGANEYRIAGLMNIPPEEAKQIIDNYLDSYPELRTYMEDQEWEAITTGKVRTKFGRVRHLREAKVMYERYGHDLFHKGKMKKKYDEAGVEIYYTFRNLMNNAKNFPIQSTAAHVANAALIKLADLFVEHEIEGHICLQIHDEITCLVKEKHAELASRLLKEAMEDNVITQQIDIPILAEPLIAENFAEAK